MNKIYVTVLVPNYIYIIFVDTQEALNVPMALVWFTHPSKCL